MNGDEPVRVVIADDQTLVRAGLRMILESESGIDVVAEASNGADAVAAVRACVPHLVLMDIRMPGMDGIEATRLISAMVQTPTPRVLILTTFDADEYVLAALRAGASGFLLKDAPAEDLLRGAQVVVEGDSLLAPSIARRLIERFVRVPEVAAVPGLAIPPSVSAREVEVLKEVAGGFSNTEIAERLFISLTTVKSHVSSLLMKLGLRDRVQLVIFAYEVGLVRPRRGGIVS